jgi:hypothetical protein
LGVAQALGDGAHGHVLALAAAKVFQLFAQVLGVLAGELGKLVAAAVALLPVAGGALVGDLFADSLCPSGADQAGGE